MTARPDSRSFMQVTASNKDWDGFYGLQVIGQRRIKEQNSWFLLSERCFRVTSIELVLSFREGDSLHHPHFHQVHERVLVLFGLLEELLMWGDMQLQCFVLSKCLSLG